MEHGLLVALRTARRERDVDSYGSVIDESLGRDIAHRDGDDGQDGLVQWLNQVQVAHGGQPPPLRVTVRAADGSLLVGAMLHIGLDQVATDAHGQANVIYPAAGMVQP
jgi:hypothetical protein